MSLDGTSNTFIPYTINGINPIAGSINTTNFVKYSGNTSNTDLGAFDLTTVGTISAQNFAIPDNNTNNESWITYSISTMGNLSTVGGLITTDLTNGRSMYFTGGVLGAPNFQFTTLGSGGKVVATDANGVMSTTIGVGQLNYITGLTSQAGGVDQTNTWTFKQIHTADVSTTGTNKFIQPYNATTLDISTLVNRATLDSAIAGLGAGILTLNNIWGYANTNNLNGGLKTIQNATQFNPSLDANSYFITGVSPTTYVFTTNWTVNPVSGTTANVALDPAVFYFDTNHKYVISFTGIYGTGASWVGTVFNNSTSLMVSDASIAITTSPQNLTMTFTAGSSNPTIYLRFVGASGTLRWTNFTIKEVDAEIIGNLTLSSQIDSNIIQSNGRTATLANGLKVNQTSLATAPNLTTASLPTGVSASTLSGSYSLTATAGGTTFGVWLGSSFTYIAGAKYTFTFTGFSTNATATQAMILYTNTYTGGSGTFIGDYIVNVPITSSTVSGFFTATSNNNVVFNFVSSASGKSISFTGFTLTRADTEIPSNLYAPRITTATSIAMTTAGGTLTMASNGSTTHVSGDNSYAKYGPSASYPGYTLVVGATPDIGSASIGQLILTNGNIFLDASNGQSIYYGNYQTSRGGTGTHEFYGNRFLYGNDSVIGSLTINNGTSAFIRKNGSTTGYNMTINGGTATNSPYVEFFAGGTSRGYIGNATTTDLDLVAQNGAKLNFYTAGTKRMEIDTTGQVNVLGNFRKSNDVNPTTTHLSLFSGGASNTPYIDFTLNGTRKGYVGYGSATTFDVSAENGSQLQFLCAGLLRSYIDTAGNFFVGSSGREIIVNNMNGPGQFRMVQGSYGVFFRQDGSDTYILITNPGDQYGNWSGLRPFSINNASGRVSMNNGLTMNGSDMTVNRILSANTNRRIILSDGDGTNYIINNSGSTPVSFGPGNWNNGGYTLIARESIPSGQTAGLGLSGGLNGSGSTARGVVCALTPGIVWGELILSAGTIYTACFGTINNYTNGGGWVFTSDKRVKKDIKDIKTARSLERIMALKPKTYKKIYPENSETPVSQEVRDAYHIGFLAQDVQETNPHCVLEHMDDSCVCDGDDGKRLGIAYGDINIHMVGAIQELKKQNDAQQKQIDDLQEMVKALMAKLI
jgi:hypothetical protein